jgi:hypothetical protein
MSASRPICDIQATVANDRLGSTPVIENCEPDFRFGSETGHRAWPLIAMPSLLCFDLWSSPNPRDRRCNWRFLGFFASAQDAEDASDADS